MTLSDVRPARPARPAQPARRSAVALAERPAPVAGVWSDLPPRLAPLMKADVMELASEICREIGVRVPEYSRPWDVEHRGAIRCAVELALNGFVARIGRSTRLTDTAEVHQAIGRAEHGAGRSLDALHAAYWVGARLAWKRWSTLADTAGIEPALIYQLGDAVLAHVDELALDVTDGYSAAAAAAADGEQIKARQRLLNMLVAEPPFGPEALAAAATAARWPLPESAAVVMLDPNGRPDLELPGNSGNSADPAARPRNRPQLSAPPDVLASTEGEYFLVVPGPDAATVAAKARRWVPPGWLAVAGPPGPPRALPSSFRSAGCCLDLVRRGIVDPPPEGTVLPVADHLGTAVLFRDEDLLRVLIDRYLGPLDQLADKRQERMVDTLLAWLNSGRRPPETADRLGVHPQTVRYRIRQAATLFGSTLYDSANQLDFEMALRAWRLLRPST